MFKRKLETIAFLSLIFALPIPPEHVGYSITSLWWTHFVYMFFHAGFLHLIMNGYALFFVYNENLGKKSLLIAYLIAVATSFFSSQDIPTVGASAMIYAFIGLNMYRYKAYQIAAVHGFLLVGYILPGINATVHVLAFAVGSLGYYIKKVNLKYKDDNRRITGRE